MQIRGPRSFFLTRYILNKWMNDWEGEKSLFDFGDIDLILKVIVEIRFTDGASSEPVDRFCPNFEISISNEISSEQMD